jgi:threonine/homoserine/homoserine lactone efflux protein
MGAVLQNFIRNQKQMQLFNICMAVLLVGSIATMALTQIGGA